LKIDYTKIYSEDELNIIEEKKSGNLLDSNGKT
jgi:hypothetical protein